MEQHTIICRTCCVGGCTFSTSITFSRDEMDMFLEGLKLIQIFVFVLGILKKILRYMRVRTRGITKGAIPSSFLPPLGICKRPMHELKEMTRVRYLFRQTIYDITSTTTLPPGGQD
ncbi:uncharacterized protein LOC126882111 isoform X1 [Diabrotica virgifera virgifera]|uniref:Uncharacterized protein n=1 Tax=Diabrotica virgifera virgifera TaxID=50390 RepID=A0ABM5JY97_DIAVI|nr:uncharacterized protein LOC126882111 isoform X1 [Diabrotica virgifera virgifera]